VDIVDFVRTHIHLSSEQLFNHINGPLTSPEKEAVEKHLQNCRFCRTEVKIWTELKEYVGFAEEEDNDEYDLEDLCSHDGSSEHLPDYQPIPYDLLLGTP
jgi:hypothetical protein